MSGALHQRRLAALATANAIPLWVALELTRRCTFACEHCYVSLRDDPRALPEARWLSLLDELAAAGTLFLTLTGGEPLLSPHWRAIVARARGLGFKIAVLTNGALVDEATAEALAAAHATVEVSVHAVDAPSFARLTGRPGSWRAVERGLGLLAATGVELVLKTPVTSHNARQLGEIEALAAALGASFEPSPVIVPRDDGGREPLQLRLAPEAMSCYFSERRPERQPGEGAPPRPPADLPMCGAGTRYAVVDPAGEVLACNLLRRSAGCVVERPFGQIWRGSVWLEELRATRWDDLELCRDCARFAYCNRCPAQALLEDGDLRGPSSAACARAEAIERAFEKSA